MKILISEPRSYCEEAIAIYHQLGDVILADDWIHIESVLADIDVLVVKLKYTWPHEILSKATRLRIIVTSTTGLNHIQLPAQSSVEVVSLKDETEFLSTVTPTAELTWALILNLSRNIPAAIENVKALEWNRDNFVGRELSGSTIGIIGYGRLGRMVAAYALAFGMRVQVYDNNADCIENLKHEIKSVGLDVLMQTSDVVTVHIPLVEDNINFINKSLLSQLRPNSFFVNTSRGEVVDEVGLLELLQKKRIAGVGLDVLSDETSGKECWLRTNPFASSDLLGSRLLITPHIGGACVNSMNRTELFVARKTERFLKGCEMC